MTQINEVETTLKYAEKIIKIASSFEGQVFGEYVREVVVPRSEDPYCNVIFENIDIWFKNQTLCNKFVQFFNDVEGHLSSIKEENIGLNDRSVTQSYLVLTSIKRLCLNIFVDDMFPIHDLDINCLSYFYSHGVQTVRVNYSLEKCANLEDFETYKTQVIRNINNKHATMLDSYFCYFFK